MTISPITTSPTARKRTRAKDFWHGFNTALLWIGAVGSVVAAVLIVTNKVHFTRVLSNSMAPAFHRGDILMVKPFTKTELQQGQVVVLPNVDKDGSQFVHRLINVEVEGRSVKVETKGDANPVKDPWMLDIKSQEVPLVIGQLPTAKLPIVDLGRDQIMMLMGLLFALFVSLFVPSSAYPRWSRGQRGRHKPKSNI